MKQRSQTLRTQALKRDNFTCQKCKIQDKTGKNLEIHHITPLVFEGKDEIDNVITLCKDCHKYAPNHKEEFEEYVNYEMDGTSTMLIKAFDKVRKESPGLFDSLANETSQGTHDVLIDEDLFRKVGEKL